MSPAIVRLGAYIYRLNTYSEPLLKASTAHNNDPTIIRHDENARRVVKLRAIPIY